MCDSVRNIDEVLRRRRRNFWVYWGEWRRMNEWEDLFESGDFEWETWNWEAGLIALFKQ